MTLRGQPYLNPNIWKMQNKNMVTWHLPPPSRISKSQSNSPVPGTSKSNHQWPKKQWGQEGESVFKSPDICIAHGARKRRFGRVPLECRKHLFCHSITIILYFIFTIYNIPRNIILSQKRVSLNNLFPRNLHLEKPPRFWLTVTW